MPHLGSTPGRSGAYVNVTDLPDGCPVCGHPDQCSALADASVVWCYRPDAWTGNRVRTKHAKDGRAFGTFHRSDTGEYVPGAGRKDVPTDDVPPDASEADRRRFYSHDRLPTDDLDAAYRAFLGALDLGIGHQHRLLEVRGFSPPDIERGMYRSFPSSLDIEQRAINAVFRVLLKTFAPEVEQKARDTHNMISDLFGAAPKQLRDYVLDGLGQGGLDDLAAKLLGVPGVWREPLDEGGRWHFGVPGTSGILIPTFDSKGRVVALAIRLDNPTAKGARYLPPCSPKKLPSGARSGSPLAIAAHVPLGSSPRARIAVITEGNFKADRAAAWAREQLGDDAVIIAVPNVGAYRLGIDLAIEMGADTILFAFDVDAKRKGGVSGALTAAVCEAAKSVHVGALAWPESSGKGIDDVIQGRHADTIKVLEGDAAWPFIAEARASAGLPEHAVVAAHVALADVIDKTKGDATYPLDPRIVRSLAVLDETSREFQRLRAELEKLLKTKRTAALDKAIRDARKVADEDDEPDEDDSAWAPEYVTENGATCLVTDDGGRRRLANFVATISKVVSRDDGATVEKEFHVTGKTTAGITLATAFVHADRFDDRAWVRRAWGGQAVVEAGRDVFGHVIAAIERASKPEHVVLYGHTGWRNVDGKNVFLIPEHLPGIDVDVGMAVQRGRYHLPPPPDPTSPELRAAVRDSLSLLNLSPARILVPVVAGAYLAPLCSSLDVDFALWLAGLSGGLKSALAALVLSHFGSFAYNALPLSWSSTANQIELALFKLADVAVAIDDFKPDIERGHIVASRTVQAIGNRANRGRLNRGSQEIAARPPRAFVISTGEELPTASSDSTVGRLVTVRVPHDALSKSAIIDASRLAPSLRLAMSGYVTWLGAEEHRDIANRYRDKHVARFEQVLDGAGHARTPRNVGTLFAGLTTFLRFATDVGAVTKEEASARALCAQEALELVAHEQAQSLADTMPHERYITAIRTMLTSGTNTLASRYDDLDAEKGIGWDDPEEGRVYLHAEAAWHAVERWQTQAGSRWPYERTSLHRALVERGIARDGGDDRHPGVHRVRVGVAGKPTWVLDLDRTHIDHALRGPSAEDQAERQAAAEAEANELAAHLSQTFN